MKEIPGQRWENPWRLCHVCISVTKVIELPLTPSSYADVSFKASAPEWLPRITYDARMEYSKKLSKESNALKEAFYKRYPFMIGVGSKRISDEQSARPLIRIESQTFELDTPQRTPARRQANEFGGLKKGFLS